MNEVEQKFAEVKEEIKNFEADYQQLEERILKMISEIEK